MGNSCCGNNQLKPEENHEVVNAPQNMDMNESRLQFTEDENSVHVLQSPSPKKGKQNQHEHSESFELTRETKGAYDSYQHHLEVHEHDSKHEALTHGHFHHHDGKAHE